MKIVEADRYEYGANMMYIQCILMDNSFKICYNSVALSSVQIYSIG